MIYLPKCFAITVSLCRIFTPCSLLKTITILIILSSFSSSNYFTTFLYDGFKSIPLLCLCSVLVDTSEHVHHTAIVTPDNCYITKVLVYDYT